MAPKWTGNVRVTGTIEADFVWARHEDAGDAALGPGYDLFIGTVDLGVEADFGGWLRGNAIFHAGNLGPGEDAEASVDEAMLNFQRDGFPFYLALGKRAQPFGVFEDHLVADPLVQAPTRAAGAAPRPTRPPDTGTAPTGFTQAWPIPPPAITTRCC